mgnify:CR=1 FL=1
MDLVNKFLVLQQSLIGLSIQNGSLEQDVNFKIKNILKSCCRQLNVARVSVWLFSDNKQSIICQNLYNHANDSFETGFELEEKLYPNYFKALKKNRVINADDARTDQRTNEFLESYLKPLNIMSMLDVPIFSEGGLIGLICIEQTTQHNWDMAEISYSVSVADNISLIYAQANWFLEKQKLSYLEKIDPLTNIENRLFFQKRIKQAVTRKLHKNNCAVILVGLDGFTNINDRFGYNFANKVLCEIAFRLENITAEIDFKLARVAGDVFAFWLPKVIDEKSVQRLTVQIQQQFTEELKTPTNEMILISACLGVYISNINTLAIEDPIRKAELALKKAKEEAYGSVCYYDADWSRSYQDEIALEKEFIEALNNAQITPYYQPIVKSNYQTKGISLESLVRWVHPTKGVISPFIILPVAQRLGLMKELGDVVLERAFQDLRMFLDKGVKINKISVNISSEQLFSPNLINQVKGYLEQYQISPSLIEFEIVEELMAGDSEALSKQIEGLINLGIDLSIDDFGTGYSSLSRLKNLQVSKLKIDKSFVDGLPDNENDICIAKSIIGLAKGMNLELVAEGVETKAQASWLFQHGCDYLQGYLISKPIPSNEISEFIAKQSQLPLVKAANYQLSLQDNIINVSVSGSWDSIITLEFFTEIEKLILSNSLIACSLIIDTTYLDIGTIGFQNSVKSNVYRLKRAGIYAVIYIINNNELLKEQLDMLTDEELGFKVRFVKSHQTAHEWLSEN